MSCEWRSSIRSLAPTIFTVGVGLLVCSRTRLLAAASERSFVVSRPRRFASWLFRCNVGSLLRCPFAFLLEETLIESDFFAELDVRKRILTSHHPEAPSAVG